MESPLGSNLVHLEIVNGNLSPWGISRLAKLDFHSYPVVYNIRCDLLCELHI